MYKFDIIIKDLRTSAKLTQKELAFIIGVSQQTISLWESGFAVPDATAIIAISKYFNVSSDYLLGLNVANKRHYIKQVKINRNFKKSELEQVRSILDFLREQKRKWVDHFFFYV